MSEPQPPGPPRRLDLAGLLRATLRLYRAHPRPVLLSTASIVVVVYLIMGAGLNQITPRYQRHLPAGTITIEELVTLFVILPLVNATLVRVVKDLEQGSQPSVGAAVQRGLDVFAPALVATLLYVAGLVLGLSLFFLPGIYVGVLWIFAPQAVAIDGRRGFGALARSAELVSGNWFRVLGSVVAIFLIAQVPAFALGRAIDAAARAADAEVVSLLGGMVVQLFSLSFVALAVALLFFDLRAARLDAPAAPSSPFS